jgi:cyclic pyranopterin monophosphate synthase
MKRKLQREKQPPDPSVADWTHVDTKGRAQMVDVTPKKATHREAWAQGTVLLKQETLEKIRKNEIKKGDVLSVAKIAAVLAAKKTPDLIPLCHPLRLTQIEVSFSLDKEPPRVTILARVQAQDRTGVEMEALTAVAAAALTIYDMCKAIDRGMHLTDMMLLKKTGGKSGPYVNRGMTLPGTG